MKSRQLIIAIIFLIFSRIEEREATNLSCGIRPETVSSSNRWPWHAAIYHVVKEQPTTTGPNYNDYQCGGTLINLNTVLTTAFCVSASNSRQSMDPKSVSVWLGKLDLKSENEENSQYFDVFAIYLHPDYIPIDKTNNIAFVRLSVEATINDFVRPICLWDSSKDLIGREATVVGWTKDTDPDNKLIKIQQLNMSVASSEVCRNHSEFYGEFLRENCFCAALKNGSGSGVCRGYSGGSIAFKDNEVYYIPGIISVTEITDENVAQKIFCNSNGYVIFTEVAPYIPWIDRADACTISVKCSSSKHRNEMGEGYGPQCIVDLKITSAQRNCKIMFDQSPNTAVAVLFIQGALHALPDFADAFNKFPNVTHLYVAFMKLKIVERNKLVQVKKISYLNLWGNNIIELKADTFHDLENLEILILNDNRLKVVHENLFRKLFKIREIWLRNNLLVELPEGLFKDNNQLQKLFASENKLKVISIDFVNLSNLRLIDFLRNDCIDEACSVCTSCIEMQKRIRNQCKCN